MEEILATLHIKNLPESYCELLRARARRERRSIAQEATHLLAAALESPEVLSILELRGLGKEVWRGVEPSPIFYSSWGPETLKPAERLGSNEKQCETVVPRHVQLLLIL